MKKLPTYIGVIIFVVTLLINWLLPSLAKVLNTFFIWTIVACLLYTTYYWIRYWLYVRNRDNRDSSKSVT
ncbi:hypothetical protein [Streptococcus suis]|uniref:hypothetical protein n=1 Tax=Streptococcus sp. VTCC 12886 TaxID=3413767 RepID=UPI0024106DD3|nr:hypothetical protein [Streptococcus suis]